jgi:hypothetical protein
VAHRSKKARVDSQAAEDHSATPPKCAQEVIVIDDTPDTHFTSPAIDKQPMNTRDITSVIKSESSDAVEEISGFTPPATFNAPITVNGQRIGQLTADKIVLESKEFTGEDGAEVAVARPGKRILRLGGANAGYDGWQLTLPRTFCRAVDITYTSQGCRAIIDGDVVFQQIKSVNQAEAHLNEVVTKLKEEDAAKAPPPPNSWYELYIEWRTWTDAKLAAIQKMNTFPRMPELAKRCKDPNCTRVLPNGKKRELRHIDHCRHDIEWWFRDAAGGYNVEYYAIVKYEEKKWTPTNLYEGSKEITERQLKFRNMAGEMWRYAYEMADTYEKNQQGYGGYT